MGMGIHNEFLQSYIFRGQKSKMALGAVFWTRPHLVALDEPTNYLDPETVQKPQLREHVYNEVLKYTNEENDESKEG